SQWAMRLHKRLGRHSYEGLALGAEEQQRLVRNLGNLDGLILENHGTLTISVYLPRHKASTGRGVDSRQINHVGLNRP
ncbi:MAG: hypothetical protein ABIR35_08135, partial [Polaromonas sp.]